MKSYRQLYQRLPEEFIDMLSKQYSPNEIDKILAGFMNNRPVTLRVNRLKTDVRQVMDTFRNESIKFDRVLWYEDALIIRNRQEKHMEEHELYKKGHIYLQSLSSMIPPLALCPKPGYNVLDLTAAPGSKSTQLAAIMENKGYVLANEINRIRAGRLKFNIERQGAHIVEVRVGDGKKLEDMWHEFFDAVLLDAPCSGAGRFSIDDSRTYKDWSERNVSRLAKEQKRLLDTAFWALKPGGTLIYSTCALMQEENEENIISFLDTHSDEALLDKLTLPLSGTNACFRYVGLDECRESMVLIIPTDLYEGFFIAKIKKLT